MTTLPTPSAIALQHSHKLLEVIRHEISSSGGYISFAHFMDLALYTPGLGYYSAGNLKLGKDGDYVTAPEISSLFAQSIAHQCEQIFMLMKSKNILEVGAGTGKFAADLLLELEKLACLPHHYYILEVSADLRSKQNYFLETKCPHLLSRVRWLERLPEVAFSGIIFANEVLDAMPTHCFQIDEKKIKERCVTLVNDQLSWVSVPPTTAELTQQVIAIQKECPLPNGFESEVNLLIPAWIKTMGEILKEGVILLFDYGYGQREYYRADRNNGTLMCYYQHRRHTDPFYLPGLQDITAHVDFTAVAQSAHDVYLTLAGYTTQAAFLLACGIIELASGENLSPTEQYNQSQAIKTLTLPAEMGELIKVMALSKNVDTPLMGFSMYERRQDL